MHFPGQHWALVHITAEHCTRSRSEQAPGSEFHPRDKSDKIDCGFFRPFWSNKKLDPKRYIPDIS